jgi:hypothetical protein
VNWIQNLEQGKGLKCKIEWIRTGLQIEFTNQGLRCKVYKGTGLWDNVETLRGFIAKGIRIFFTSELFL